MLAMAAAGAFGPAGISGLIREAMAEGDKPIAPGMRKITGSVTVNGQPAREGQLVRAGDTIVTGPKSEAIYVIGQDAYMQREKSTISFAAEAAASVMRVITGGILSVFGKGQKRLEVPTATIGIRGTGCYIEASPKTVYFCLCYGVAEVAPAADPKQVERIETTHHDHPILIHNDSAMPMMAPASVINHTDRELLLLENLVGRWPPFYGKPGISGY
ncbi:MAG: hypothetical protein QG616_1967 [Pseudomonadota bacterium]|nr:hypothetical protein [Pseudomonadota bacterium]